MYQLSKRARSRNNSLRARLNTPPRGQSFSRYAVTPFQSHKTIRPSITDNNFTNGNCLYPVHPPPIFKTERTGKSAFLHKQGCAVIGVKFQNSTNTAKFSFILAIIRLKTYETKQSHFNPLVNYFVAFFPFTITLLNKQ